MKGTPEAHPTAGTARLSLRLRRNGFPFPRGSGMKSLDSVIYLDYNL